MGVFNYIGRLFERRSTVRNPADWLAAALGGASTTVSGETVGADKALTLSSYFSALRNVSDDCGKLPLILYKRLKPEGKERMPGHPLHKLLHDSPNRDMGAMSFRATLTFHAMGWGNGIAEIVRDKSGRPVAIWPIDPTRVRIERDKQQNLHYIVRPAIGGDDVVFEPKDIFHLAGLGYDGLTGYSIAHLARESLGSALAMEKSGAALFGNACIPGVVLTAPNVMSDDQRAANVKSWEDRNKGAGKHWSAIWLDGGLTATTLAIPNRDSQWIEARQFMVSEFCRWARIPPHKIHDLTHGTYSNIDAQNIEYVVDSLGGWLTRWEQEIARKLIPRGSGLFAEHLVDGLLRGDTEKRYAAYRSAILSGWMSRNEARVRENMNPQEGLDEFLIPLNTGEVGGDT